jgi:hypothetical protein
LAFDDGVNQMEGLGESQPPALLSAAVQVIIQQPEVRAYLKDIGHWIVRKGLGEIKDAIFGKPKPSSPWMASTLDPIIDLVGQGVVDELAKRSRPYILGIAGLTGLAAFGLGALIGNARRGRACAKQSP